MPSSTKKLSARQRNKGLFDPGKIEVYNHSIERQLKKHQSRLARPKPLKTAGRLIHLEYEGSQPQPIVNVQTDQKTMPAIQDIIACSRTGFDQPTWFTVKDVQPVRQKTIPKKTELDDMMKTGKIQYYQQMSNMKNGSSNILYNNVYYPDFERSFGKSRNNELGYNITTSYLRNE